VLFCTIVSRRELARARVLVSSLRQHHPDAAATVLLLDGKTRGLDPIDGARLVALADVVENFGALGVANPPEAVPVAVMPHLLKHELAEHRAAVYLGPGLRVLGPLSRLLEMLEQHDLVLASRTRLPAAGDVFGGSVAGAFSQRIVGVRAGAGATELFETWPTYFSPNGGDPLRAWFDGLAATTDDVGVLRDPAYGLDPVSVVTAPTDEGGDGLTVAGQPARVFDFSELDPRDPTRICAGEARVQLSSFPPLAELAARHATELLEAGYADDVERPVPFIGFDDGVRLTPVMRSLFLEALREGALADSPLSESGRREFYDYLNVPAESGASLGLTRLHMAIWRSRPELQSAYHYLDGPDGPGYAGWLVVHGPSQEGLAPPLLPPAPQHLDPDAHPPSDDAPPLWGVNVAGFYTSESGLGEAARLVMTGLDARGIPALPVQGRLRPPHRQGEAFAHATLAEAPFPINLMCITGDSIPVLAREAGTSFFTGRYNIALWWWELSEFPAGWEEAFEYLDEVWVGSQHIGDAIAPASPVPVVKITLPVSMPVFPPRSRAELGLPADGFLFLFVHDYHSVAARKNPVGAVEAFKRAFAPGAGAKLFVKSINAAHHREEHDRVLAAAQDHPDIVVRDEYASAAEKNAMIGACDCYLSLHRSEGFGLTVAEAMLLAKPVIVTGYGGTLEFTSAVNSYLVDWQPAAVGEGAFPYPATATWAEPDLDQAADLMRAVFANPDAARARGQIARRQIMERHAPITAGATIERRLQLIHDRMRKEGSRLLNVARLPRSLDSARIAAAIEDTPTADARGPLAPLKRFARARSEKLIRGWMLHQRSVDREVLSGFTQLDERLTEMAAALTARQQAQRAELLASVRSLRADLASVAAELAALRVRSTDASDDARDDAGR
jgi:glycosyltransferase involved in cell wall biosynthesis